MISPIRPDREPPATAVAAGTPVPGASKGQRPWGVLRGRLPTTALLALCVVALLLAVIVWQILSEDAQQPAPVDVEAAVSEALSSLTPSPALSAQVYQAILPSFVVVQSDREEEPAGVAVGSGVVINSDAFVLTSFHIVEGSSEIRLGFADGTRTQAFIANADPERDIAVLAPSSLPGLVVPATIGNSSSLRVGDEVFAVGNPLGLVGSLSAGVVSGIGRQSAPHGRDEAIQGLIQFDAAVNPGNSGGPLLDRGGRLVGIVTGLMNPTDQDVFIGIGFAVPIEIAATAAGGPGQ